MTEIKPVKPDTNVEAVTDEQVAETESRETKGSFGNHNESRQTKAYGNHNETRQTKGLPPNHNESRQTKGLPQHNMTRATR